MEKKITKYFFVLLTVLLIQPSCVKDMVIDVQDINREIVVSCLFNPNDIWKLTLSKTKSLQDKEDIFVDNASVEIITEAKKIITLIYSGKNGTYTNDSYPEIGKAYTLKINIPGHKEITAKSKVPNYVKAIVPNFKIKWKKYLNTNNMLDYEVFPLTIHFEKIIENARFLFHAQEFNPEEGYKRYMLTSESLKKLKEAGLPQNAYKKFLKLIDQWCISCWEYEKILDSFVEDHKLRSELNSIIHDEVKQKTVSTREKEAFSSTTCFGNDSWLNNISYDVFTVLGEGKNIKTVNLLYGNANLKYSIDQDEKCDKEYWIEILQGSNDYIDYYHTYILQVSQRINPYSEPVMVHSNINNATGIFAGFNRQMIHLFNY